MAKMKQSLYTQVELGNPLQMDFSYNNNVAGADLTVRMGFLRKVYTLLCTQLLITCVCAGTMFYFKDAVLEHAQTNMWAPVSLMLSTFVVILLLMWKRQETPINYVLLYIFTLTESLLVGYAVTAYSAAIVLEAVILTAATTFCLTLYTFQSKRDFSHWSLGLSIGLVVLILAGPISFVLGSSLLELTLAIGGSILFSLIIIFDTHRIMHHCSAEDYVLACIDLYLDIVNLFLHILRVLKEVDRS